MWSTLCKASLGLFSLAQILSGPSLAAQEDRSSDCPDMVYRITTRVSLEREAYHLVYKGQLEEAIAKFNEALHPSLLCNALDRAHPLWGIMRVHQAQGKFELALEEVQWFVKLRPNKDTYQNKKLELEALIKAKETKTNTPIYEFIKDMRERYKTILPPEDYMVRSSYVTSIIIVLYDYMGDTDGGIAFVDPISKFRKNVPGIHQAYQNVKKAFEQDKLEGTQGRATQAILGSKYFPFL